MNIFRAYIEKILFLRKERKYLNKLNDVMGLTILRSNLFEDKVTFKHIGLIGDIIYSIPCMLALAKGKNIVLYLDLGENSMYPKKFKHFNEGKILTENSISFLKPLLLSIPSIVVCEKFTNQLIDYNLNDFRKYPFDYRMGSISRYYFLTFGVNFDLGKAWININETLNNKIVIARSFRYRSPNISYNFLSKYKDIIFLGLPDEFEDMKIMIPHIQYASVKNALEMAEIIAGSKLFIGNQSFPFALAEALKIKRVLEVCYLTPNVIVEGPNGYDFCYQKQFEQIINDIIKNNEKNN